MAPSADWHCEEMLSGMLRVWETNVSWTAAFFDVGVYSRRLGRDQLHTGGGDDNESKLVENGHDCGDEKDKDGGE